jgi:hypothetical protein
MRENKREIDKRMVRVSQLIAENRDILLGGVHKFDISSDLMLGYMLKSFEKMLLDLPNNTVFNSNYTTILDFNNTFNIELLVDGVFIVPEKRKIQPTAKFVKSKIKDGTKTIFCFLVEPLEWTSIDILNRLEIYFIAKHLWPSLSKESYERYEIWFYCPDTGKRCIIKDKEVKLYNWKAMEQRIDSVALGMLKGDYARRPLFEKCRNCPYSSICNPERLPSGKSITVTNTLPSIRIDV